MSWGGIIAVQNVYQLEFQGISNPNDTILNGDMGEYLEGIYSPLQLLTEQNLTFIDFQVVNETQAYTLPLGLWPTLVQGQHTADVTATGVALLVRAVTAVQGSQGRKFFGTFTELSITNALVIATHVAALALAAAAWISPFTGTASGGLYQPGLFTGTPKTFKPFTQAIIGSIPSYQRRRRQGRGI
jgi:hypothetical protein